MIYDTTVDSIVRSRLKPKPVRSWGRSARRKPETFGPPQPRPPGDPGFVGPPSPVGPSQLQGPSFTRASGQRDVDPDSPQGGGFPKPLSPMRFAKDAYAPVDAVHDRSIQGYADLGRALGVNDFPGATQFRGVAHELTDPRTIASMFAPVARGPQVGTRFARLAKPALQNALIQGGANVALDAVTGRLDEPADVAASGAFGAAFGAALTPGMATALAAGAKRAGMEVADFAASPEGVAIRRSLASERGSLSTDEYLAKIEERRSGQLREITDTAPNPAAARRSLQDEVRLLDGNIRSTDEAIASIRKIYTEKGKPYPESSADEEWLAAKLADRERDVFRREQITAMLGGELGGIAPKVAARIGGAATGGVTGATQGDTPQERIRNALIGAGLGAAGVEVAMRSPAVRRAIAEGERGALGKGDLPIDDASKAAAGDAVQPAADNLPSPPELPSAAQHVTSSLPEVFGPRGGLLTESGDLVRMADATNRDAIVQGVSLERSSRRPPGIGGRDIVGDKYTRDAKRAQALLDRDASMRVDAFEERAREMGAPEQIVRTVATGYRDAEVFASTARRYADSNVVMQNLAKGAAWVEGNVPDGVVNAVARAHLAVENGVRQYIDDTLPQLGRIDAIIARAMPKLTFIGPQKMAQFAEEYAPNAVVTHPEWFSGKSAELKVVLEELQRFQNDVYKGVGAIDPNAAPALDAPYLSSVWDIPESQLTSAVSMPIGRASVTKKRTFPDPFEAMTDPKWPFKLKQTPVSELVSHSSHLAARQIGAQFERTLILRRFGSTHKKPGYMPFRNANYAGWYAKPEIVNFIDQLHEPAGSFTRQVGNVTSPVRNTIFGVMDIGVFGQHVTNLLSTRGPLVLAGAINRGLEQLGLGVDVYRMADADLPRAIQRTLDNLPQGQAGRVGDPGGKTIPGMLPKVGRPIDQAVDALNQAQFGGVLTPLRNMAYEGNLIVDKLLHSVTGRKMFDITNPVVRRRAADNAAAFSGASTGALRTARRAGERSFLGAPQITRAMAAELAQVAKLNTPEAWTTLASIAAVVYGIGSAYNMAFGSGEPVPLDPRRVDWATVTIGGKWQDVDGKRRYVGGVKWRIIPQASLVRALGKSMNAIQESDPERLVTAWQQLAFTRATPALQMPFDLVGTGFTDEGYFTVNLPWKQRMKNLIPAPISARDIARGKADTPSSVAGTLLGAATFPGDTVESIREDDRQQGIRDFNAAAEGSGVQYNDGRMEFESDREFFEDEGWGGRFADETGLDISGETSIGDIKARYIEAAKERYAQREGITIPQAENRLGAYFDRLPPVRALTKQISLSRLRIWREYPELLRMADELGLETLNRQERSIAQ